MVPPPRPRHYATVTRADVLARPGARRTAPPPGRPLELPARPTGFPVRKPKPTFWASLAPGRRGELRPSPRRIAAAPETAASSAKPFFAGEAVLVHVDGEVFPGVVEAFVSAGWRQVRVDGPRGTRVQVVPVANLAASLTAK